MSAQVNDILSDSFRGYAKLLRQIKQRVLLAQQRAIYAANEGSRVLNYATSGCAIGQRLKANYEISDFAIIPAKNLRTNNDMG